MFLNIIERQLLVQVNHTEQIWVSAHDISYAEEPLVLLHIRLERNQTGFGLVGAAMS